MGAESTPPPVITIRPRRGWASIDFRELWAYRQLLLFLIWRDLKVRYRQTALGALWAVIQPLLLLVVFTLVLGRIAGIGSTDTPYPVFVFAALVPWTLFAQSVIGSSNSLVNAASMIEKVYFPRLLLPLASVGAFLIDFGISMVILVLIMLTAGHVPGLAALWIVPLTGLCMTAALAIGIWFSAINVRYRDVRHAVPFLVQVGLFATPVAYSADLLPEAWRRIYQLNPMVGVIDGFRWALLGGTSAPIEAVAVSLLVTGVVLATGLMFFRRVERTFADVI